jgi:hypothetical protein
MYRVKKKRATGAKRRAYRAQRATGAHRKSYRGAQRESYWSSKKDLPEVKELQERANGAQKKELIEFKEREIYRSSTTLQWIILN